MSFRDLVQYARRHIRSIIDWVSNSLFDEPVNLRLSGGGYLITEQWEKKRVRQGAVEIENLIGKEAIYREKGFFCLVSIVKVATGPQPRVRLRFKRNLVSFYYPPPPLGEEFEVGSSFLEFSLYEACMISRVQLGFWGIYFDEVVLDQVKMIEEKLHNADSIKKYKEFSKLCDRTSTL